MNSETGFIITEGLSVDPKTHTKTNVVTIDGKSRDVAHTHVEEVSPGHHVAVYTLTPDQLKGKRGLK